MKAKRAKTARVYPAESDPRQAARAAFNEMAAVANARGGANDECTREFGPWVRGADGRWERDRRKR